MSSGASYVLLYNTKIPGKSLAQVIYKLIQYLRGWWNYYRLSEARSIFKSLNGWIIRRLRCLLWTQWKNPRTKVRNLLKLGISSKHAFLSGNARKKMWRMSKIKWVIIALPNKYFLERGLYLPGNQSALSAEPPRYRSVCQVVWEGSSVMGGPIPIEFLFNCG